MFICWHSLGPGYRPLVFFILSVDLFLNLSVERGSSLMLSLTQCSLILCIHDLVTQIQHWYVSHTYIKRTYSTCTYNTNFKVDRISTLWYYWMDCGSWQDKMGQVVFSMHWAQTLSSADHLRLTYHMTTTISWCPRGNVPVHYWHSSALVQYCIGTVGRKLWVLVDVCLCHTLVQPVQASSTYEWVTVSQATVVMGNSARWLNAGVGAAVGFRGRQRGVGETVRFRGEADECRGDREV